MSNGSGNDEWIYMMEKYTVIKKWHIAVHNNMDKSLDIIMNGRRLI